jgi:zinc transport system permease protein
MSQDTADHTDESADAVATGTRDESGETVGDSTDAMARGGSPGFRGTLEYLGLGATALLAVAMVAFVAFDWLQTLSGPLGGVGEAGFEAYEEGGRALDGLLGTNVFWVSTTLRAVATGVLVGVMAPLVGAFLVHRQMALIGETLAHTAFAGVAIGVVVAGVLGLSGSAGQLVLVALVVSALAALGLQWLTAHTDAYGDVPIAITLAGSFALATLVISWGEGNFPVAIDIRGFLFGSHAIVTAGGARLIAVLTVVVVALVVFNYKQFLFITFDEQAARVARLNVRAYNSLLIVMTAVVVVGAMQILGVILVAGMLVIPSAAASQVAGSFREVLVLSVVFGQTAVLVGLGIAIIWSLPSGGAIILVGVCLYLATVAVSGREAGQLSAH